MTSVVDDWEEEGRVESRRDETHEEGVAATS